MRRIASIFNNRHSDKDKSCSRSDLPKPKPSPSLRKSSRLFRHNSPISVATEPPVPKLDQAQSSSSSSSGSTSLRTPDDERASPMNPPIPPSSRKNWLSWTGGKPHPVALNPTSMQTPQWSTEPILEAHLPPKPASVQHEGHESEEDISESSSSESEGVRASNSMAPNLTPIEFVQALTTNNVAPAFSPSPLFYRPGSVLFPRSSNSRQSLFFQETMETTVHKKRLLRRIQQQELSPSERRSLAAFGSRAASAATRRTLPQPDESAFPDVRHIAPHSRGLKRWINRPYFEERTVVWMAGEATGAIGWSHVKGSGFGVWALEISEGLELLADVTSDEVEEPHVEIAAWEPTSSASSSSSQLSASQPVTARQAPHKYKALPSPLRNESDRVEPPSAAVAAVPLLSRTVMADNVPAPALAPAPKRGVHFAEVDREDQVPIGYVLRHKKNREEKAQFLKIEQERRAAEEERRRHEAERLEWEKERAQWEQEKRAIEREKRAAEEERNKKHYADELAAARLRRESQHAIPSSSSSRELEKRGRANYARPLYDSRRLTDQSYLSLPRSRDGSSSSLKAESISRSNSGSPSPRPPSMHSNFTQSSSDDVRLREVRNSRRASMASESSQRSDRMLMYPYGWANIPPVPSLPIFPTMTMMPIMPQYVMDMPLLPPAAPFMRQQHGHRSHSQNSLGSPSRGSLPNSYSSDGVNQTKGSLSSPGHRHHRHASSDDFRGRTSGYATPNSDSSRTSNEPQMRSQQRQHSNSWVSAAPSSFSHSRPTSSRRTTALN
ncbi:hypothetical protein EW146_g1407 [Bondarzewia mesenterica]|uniref:Uncharacterized protein n=1 Tax=Bondarzewia mesenterica TaxID=1095465 RepID=A0A4S4M424_9AGAM|nr:hypothetical protein EW146_g1407 [Bondarzewia mesenterica]